MKLEGTTISWPPHGWKKISSDQRKLTWEFAATTIELKTVSCNAINRIDLLDKYNCLAPLKTENTPTTRLEVK
jgi:hypothetical protein